MNHNRFKLSDPVIYDIFPAKRDRYLCVLGPYYSKGKLINTWCSFANGEKIRGEFVDDPDCAVFILLFSIPEEDRKNGYTSITIGISDWILAEQLPFDLKPKKRRYLSATTLFKDEERFLKEWLEFHRLLGIEHFYLYDNGSKDRVKVTEILKPYIEKDLATYIPWEYPYDSKAFDYSLKPNWPSNSHLYCQIPQINHCLYKYGKESKWILAVDIDEYLCTTLTYDLFDIISKYDEENVGALEILGRWFGSSGYSKIPKDLVIERYTRCQKDPPIGLSECHKQSTGRRKACYPKCIFNTDHIQVASVHQAMCGERTLTIPHTDLVINHYRSISYQKRIDHDFANDVIDTDIHLLMKRYKIHQFILDRVGNVKEPVIVEIGACQGEDTARLIEMLDKAILYSFEPNPKNIKAIQSKRLPIRLIESAVGSYDGIASFYLSSRKCGTFLEDCSDASSIRKPKNHLLISPSTNFNETIQVPICKLDTFVSQNHIDHVDFLWVDVQGAEGDIFFGAKNILPSVRYIYTEYSNDELYDGQVNLKQLLTLLPDFRIILDDGDNILLANINGSDVRNPHSESVSVSEWMNQGLAPLKIGIARCFYTLTVMVRFPIRKSFSIIKYALKQLLSLILER